MATLRLIDQTESRAAEEMAMANRTLAYYANKHGIGFWPLQTESGGYRMLITHRYYETKQVEAPSLLACMKQAIEIASRMASIRNS